MSPSSRAERTKASWLDRWSGRGFRPAPHLGNPHAQTLMGTLFRDPPPLDMVREEWTTPDDDFIAVYMRAPEPDDAKAPVAVLLHGLEGSAASPYIRGMADRLASAGYRVVAPEHRSCSERLNRARRLYHSGMTDDLGFIVATLLRRYPQTPIFVMGVSLGGNQLGKWLGTTAVPEAVRAAAIISPPFDLTVSGPHLDRRGWVYVWHFLRTLIPKALAKEQQYPGCMDRRAVARSSTFEAFDTHATAALHGFADAQDYYRKSSCGRYLPQVQTPTLLLAAADDPFNPGTTLPRRAAELSPYLVPSFTSQGGHVGFVGGRWGRPVYWMEEPIFDFFDMHRQRED